ncbi:ankyrin repeat and LEM domain-containing protein 1 [Alca torda]
MPAPGTRGRCGTEGGVAPGVAGPSAGSYWPPGQPMSGGGAARGGFERAGRRARARGGMSGAGRREPSTKELPPPHVTASWGCHRRLQLLLKKGGGPARREQDGRGAVELALEPILWDSQRARGWPPAEDPGGGRRSLSFLTEDGTDGSVIPEDGDGVGPLSSTRRSLLEGLELGGGCGSGEPPSASIPSLTPWPPGGSSLPPQPLASSTLLSAGDELGEGPRSRTAVGGTECPPRAVPKPRREFGAGGSPRSPQSRCRSRVLGGHGASPRSPRLRAGLSGCSVACRSPGDGDIPHTAAQRRPGVPRGPRMSPPAAPELGMVVAEAGAGGCDRSSLGDSSGDSERFVTAVETLEPSEAGGSPGARHRRSPQPRAAGGLEPGEAPSPVAATTGELPPASPPNTERVLGADFGGGSRAAPRREGGSEVGDVGELLARLRGCSLRGSPPRTAEAPRSPAGPTAGDVTPRGTEPPLHRHVTPRTKSRLQASARLGASSSSSSSLFDESLEMPRRPPRLRAPRGVPRDPATTSGHCVTPGRGDASSGDGEGTGSLDDTEILPRAPSQPNSPVGASSSPSSSPTVLLVPGDRGDPHDAPSDAQGSSGSSPTVLLVPGDRGDPHDAPSDAQGSSGSSPTVLLVPGDRGDPHDAPSDAQGSSGSSPTVLLVPGDHGDPQHPLSDARGSPGSNPMVLLVPGDHGDPQDPPSDARGSPGSSPTVLLVPGDHGDPQDPPSDARGSPGSSPTVLLVPGDRGDPHDAASDAQGSSGSSPTVLLVPGDHGDPQDPPSDARGSPGSSPTVLLVPGDHGHPQDSPSDAQGSLHATRSPNPRVLEGGSGWQDPSTLGTHQPRWPHGSFSHLLAPWPPGSTAVEPQSPAVPLSPAGSTHCSQEHLEDEERGQAPSGRHSPGTAATTSLEDAAAHDGRACGVLPRPLSDEGLRRRLRALGDNPGPVTELTRWLYLRRLEELLGGRRGRPAGHSPELVAALRTGHVPDCAQDELALARQFDRPDRSRRWREGLRKSSFNYLLLDPRTTQNLPLRSHRLSPAKCFGTFVEAIFYVGKGTRARPYCHLAEALSQHRAGTQKGCPKVRRILEIWASGQGVISVHCFQNTVPAEAYTRESCILEALGLQTVTNQRKGNCYGVAASWPAARRRRLGVHMLHRAMRIFLAEGERQLRPPDIQGGH